MFHAHAQIAERKGPGVEKAHAIGLRAGALVFDFERDFPGEQHTKSYGHAGYTNQPHGGQWAGSRNDASAKQPEQDSKAESGGDGPAESRGSSGFVRVCLADRLLSRRHQQNAEEGGNNSENAIER